MLFIKFVITHNIALGFTFIHCFVIEPLGATFRPAYSLHGMYPSQYSALYFSCVFSKFRCVQMHKLLLLCYSCYRISFGKTLYMLVVCTIWSRYVVGLAVQFNITCDVCTSVKSPSNKFLIMQPSCQASCKCLYRSPYKRAEAQSLSNLSKILHQLD